MNEENTNSKNNFDGLRIALAIIVFLYHVEGLSKAKELSYLGDIFSGGFAVKCFFVISGFLITLSFIKSQNTKVFLKKRIRRVLPAYVINIFFCILIGVFSTTLNLYNFISSPQTIKFLLSHSIFLDGFFDTLPSALIGNYTRVINGSLWTIKIELFYYCCTPIILHIREVYFKYLPALLYTASTMWAWHYQNQEIQNIYVNFINPFLDNFSFYLFGMVFALNRRYLEKLPLLMLLVCFPLFGLSQAFPRLSPINEPCIYGVLVLFLATSAIRNTGLGRFGDLSYSIYLFHFPIIQFIIYLKIFSSNAYIGLFLSFLLTIIVSLLSWHFIEKRFLYRSRQTAFFNA